MEQFNKQPAETYPIAVDFNECLAPGEGIVSQEVLAYDKDGNDATAEVLLPSTIGNDGEGRVVVTVTGGDQEIKTYKLTFRCTTTNGNRWEMDIKMMVVEL